MGRALAPVRLGALLVAALLAGGAASAQAPSDKLLGDSPEIDKVPRLAGDWCCWTSDRRANASPGSVVLARLSSGERWILGDGCLPDIAMQPDGHVRLAWLAFAPDGLAVRSLVLTSDTPTDAPPPAQLAAGLRWADHVRVCGDVTAFGAADADGRPRVFACVGRGAPVAISGVDAFRPELVRDVAGVVHCVWDAYEPSPGVLNYEVWHARLGADGRWSAPENLSQAPWSTDIQPAVAAAPEGGLWVAWVTNRGGRRPVVWVEKLQPDGHVGLPEDWPPVADDPGDEPEKSGGASVPPDLKKVLATNRRGTIVVPELRAASQPRLVVDGSGRLWLFVTGQLTGNALGEVASRQLFSLVLEPDGWAESQSVAHDEVDQIEIEAEPAPADPLAVRVVYQVNSATLGLQTATRTLHREAAPKQAETPPAPELQVLSGPPAPQWPEPVPELPLRRTLSSGGREFRLAFADLHCHTRNSPDGSGERDTALFYARDVVGLDAVAITDHDERVGNAQTDWEFELGRRLVALYDTPDFIACIGCEWTSDHPRADKTEVPGHRACFDVQCCARYFDPGLETLPELFARLDADDAIGVPHHLGLFGGTSFRSLDPRAQPVVEMTSEHGQYETQFWLKLRANHLHPGVIAGGDDHTARPGLEGLAGVWMEVSGPAGEISLQTASPHEVFKTALRQHRCFGVRKDALWPQVLLDGIEPGGTLVRTAGDTRQLNLQVRLEDIPYCEGGGGLLVNLVRDGAVDEPLWQERVKPGRSYSADVNLDPPDQSCALMLRVGHHGSSRSADTILWTSPIWFTVR